MKDWRDAGDSGGEGLCVAILNINYSKIYIVFFRLLYFVFDISPGFLM
jgi:hypothetical protein